MKCDRYIKCLLVSKFSPIHDMTPNMHKMQQNETATYCKTSLMILYIQNTISAQK